ncbi:MAG: FtsX-like permease family protein [Leptospira sp.]|nr:FtsX-like permease family protein [Leptospira sp.]
MNFLQIYFLFLFRYFSLNYVKTFFSLAGISLGIALFITTMFNGERAEKSLIDFSIGFRGDSYKFKIRENDESKFIDEKIMSRLFYDPQLRWITEIVPAIQRNVRIKTGAGSINAVYLGIDPTKEQLGFTGNSPSAERNDSPTFISRALAEKISGESFNFSASGKSFKVGNFSKIDSDGGLFIAEDIRFAQKRFGTGNKLSYILLNAESVSKENIKLLENKLASINPSLRLESIDKIKERAEGALKSFHLNLLIISMISVLISFFMVSNTMSGIFLNRKKELGILRCLGVTPTGNFLLFLSQSAIVGMAGTCFGILLSALFVNLSFFQGESTVTDASQNLSYTTIPRGIIALSFVIGLGGSLVSALLSSVKASVVSPISIVREGEAVPKNRNSLSLFIAGGFVIFCGYGIARIVSPFSLPVFGLAGIGMIICGQVLLFPLLIQIASAFIYKTLLMIDISFPAFQAAIEEIRMNPGKNTLTAATLMLAVSLVISLTILSEGYRKSIIDWVDSDFPSDYSVVNQSDIEESTGFGIPESVKKETDAFIINTRVLINDKIYTIHAYDISLAKKMEEEKKRKTYPDLDLKNEILISTNMAYLGKYKIGDILQIPTPGGSRNMKIAGLREHFFSERGTIIMDVGTYLELFGKTRFSSVKIFLRNRPDAGEALRKIAEIISYDKNLKLISSKDLKEIYLSGLGKVFRVLDSLKLTACFIAILSFYSSIIHNLHDKLKTLGILRAIGANFFQIFRIVFSESLFLSGFSVIMGIFSSVLLSPVIIGVINKHAFGWTLPVVFPYPIAFLFIVASPLIALSASVYPYYFLRTKPLRETLSYE